MGECTTIYEKTTLRILDRDSNLDLSLLNSPVYCESDALDRLSTESSEIIVVFRLVRVVKLSLPLPSSRRNPPFHEGQPHRRGVKWPLSETSRRNYGVDVLLVYIAILCVIDGVTGGELYPHLLVERVKKHLAKNTLSTPDRDSNLNLPVIGSLVNYECSASDHAATEIPVMRLADYREIPSPALGSRPPLTPAPYLLTSVKKGYSINSAHQYLA
uniref:Uncharacterized protein n=1 Tax=Timema bartmani TaxID=61472 RepID=A0A7R9I6V8_9NEOP|nr:unnamed protein product [Timema bartmani]